jgi:hypothetical protein
VLAPGPEDLLLGAPPRAPFGGPRALPKNFQTFAEFEREIIRSNSRIGLSLEELVEDTSFDAELELDDDPFEAMRDDF